MSEPDKLPYKPHITISYGPYNDAGVVMHRPERILALKGMILLFFFLIKIYFM